MLAHVLEPMRHTARLQTGARSYTCREQLVSMFLTLDSRLGLPRLGALTAEHDDCATVQTLILYLVEGPSPVLALHSASASKGKDRVGAVLSWRVCPSLAGTPFAEVACRLLPVPAHAAELESVWYGMGLSNTPIRSRLDTGRLTAMTKVALRMRAEIAETKRTRAVVVPGSKIPAERGEGGRATDGGAIAAAAAAGDASVDRCAAGAVDDDGETDVGFDVDVAAQVLQGVTPARPVKRGVLHNPTTGPPAQGCNILDMYSDALNYRLFIVINFHHHAQHGCNGACNVDPHVARIVSDFVVTPCSQ